MTGPGMRSRRALERPRQAGALIDGAQRVELLGEVGAADQVGGDATLAQPVVERSPALLAGADDHVVDRERLGRAGDADVQAGIVDAL